MYERFTDRAKKVCSLANEEAHRFNHQYIETEHLLLGIVRDGAGVAAELLKRLEQDLEQLSLAIENRLESGPAVVTMSRLQYTPLTKKVIQYAMEEARNLNHNYVGTEHLLLGLLRVREGGAYELLTQGCGLNLEQVRSEAIKWAADTSDT